MSEKMSKKKKDAYWLMCVMQHDKDHQKYDKEHHLASILDM